MTKLALINLFVQFLFIRIYKSVDKGVIKGYGILYFVFPLTGWINRYCIVGNKIRFTKLIWEAK